MKSLVIAEKPSVGRDIARVLGCKKQAQNALEGENYIVTWALGHLVTLADPEDYDSSYKEWKLDVLPMMPDHMKLVVIRQSARQFQTVKKSDFPQRCKRHYHRYRRRPGGRAGCPLDSGKSRRQKVSEASVDILRHR